MTGKDVMLTVAISRYHKKMVSIFWFFGKAAMKITKNDKKYFFAAIQKIIYRAVLFSSTHRISYVKKFSTEEHKDNGEQQRKKSQNERQQG